ncbi:hypothetical protein N3K66_004003 [Trichothecium roseum]|uniref:Uncharacterized protein n=1 Tax=Trichothecium roseum TaxID=47278 RepID=A0ACC0V704_9HYPO|nr:hypothetical protein N3K66_004003 [Trichothecium roseum]
MATTETISQAQVQSQTDRNHAHRRRHFSTWVRKLANFKSSSDGEGPKKQKNKKRGAKVNNPYPESGQVGSGQRRSAVTFDTAQTGSITSVQRSDNSAEQSHPTTAGGRSGTDEAARSIMAPSHGGDSLAGTSRTVGGGIDSRRGGDSTFSSPAPSVRSLTTTLTTIQSMGPNTAVNGNSGQGHTNNQSIQFSQPFPTAPPASAIPAHLAPHGGPSTYTSATANGILTDNASILTLASSSKRHRRRSLDTDASVRALAPSSVWGGSRESLPLSVLSANIDGGLTGMASSSRLGAERNSIYSSSGVPSAIPGDRNSYYAKQTDGASVRSGRPGHNRTESAGGSTTLANIPNSEKTEEIVEEGTGKDED